VCVETQQISFHIIDLAWLYDLGGNSFPTAGEPARLPRGACVCVCVCVCVCACWGEGEIVLSAVCVCVVGEDGVNCLFCSPSA
jgi:hypothetical protein